MESSGQESKRSGAQDEQERGGRTLKEITICGCKFIQKNLLDRTQVHIHRKFLKHGPCNKSLLQANQAAYHMCLIDTNTPRQRIILPQMSIMPRLRNAALDEGRSILLGSVDFGHRAWPPSVSSIKKKQEKSKKEAAGNSHPRRLAWVWYYLVFFFNCHFYIDCFPIPLQSRAINLILHDMIKTDVSPFLFFSPSPVPTLH